MDTCAVLCFTPDGDGHGLYTEVIDLQTLGSLAVRRATVIEFNIGTQLWEVRHPDDPRAVLFTHRSRQACLDWERLCFDPYPTGDVP